MNIILGFGSTEKGFEEQECDFVKQIIEKEVKKYKDKSEFIFTNDTVMEIKKELNKRKEHYDKLDKEYKTAENYPDRHSTYSFNIIHDIHDLCIIFKFYHINRRHALSPDGWAMMEGKKVFHINVWEIRED